jgi:hypothetical protein
MRRKHTLSSILIVIVGPEVWLFHVSRKDLNENLVEVREGPSM